MSSSAKTTEKYTNFTEEDIKIYLEKFHKLIESGKYRISINKKRQENKEFMQRYQIRREKEKKILLSLTYLDFCYAVDNEKEEYSHEKLYVFNKPCELESYGEKENVEIYIKTNMIENTEENEYVVVISFHKRNKPIEYLFKKEKKRLVLKI